VLCEHMLRAHLCRDHAQQLLQVGGAPQAASGGGAGGAGAREGLAKREAAWRQRKGV
jgi:hypothetical protein